MLFLLVFFCYPVVRLLGLSIFDPEFTLANYEAALTAPVYVAVLRTTLKISLETTLLCLVLGYPLAYALSTASERARNLLIIAVVLPYFTSILVRSYAWLVLLGRHGLLNEAMVGLGIIDNPVKMIYNTTGVVIGMTHIMLPIMVLALYSVMRGIDMNLVKVSDSLGASRTQTFLRVYFPLSLPGVGAGCLLVFIFSVGFYVTPALLGGLRDTMLAMLIATQIQELLKWGFAGALSLILLVVTLALFLAFNRVMGLDRIWGGDKVRDDRPPDARAWRWPAPVRSGLTMLRQGLTEGFIRLMTIAAEAVYLLQAGMRRMLRLPAPRARHAASGVGLNVLAGAIVVFLLAPIVLIFPVSFTNSLYLEFPPSGFSLQWYRELVETSYWADSLWLSLRVAPISMLLAVVLGTMGAVALARARFPFKDAIFGFILSPIIVPVIVTAVALYYFYSQLGLVGSYWGLVIGHTVGSVPVVVVMVAAGAQGVRHPPRERCDELGREPHPGLLRRDPADRAPGDHRLGVLRFHPLVRRGGDRLVRRRRRERDPARSHVGGRTPGHQAHPGRGVDPARGVHGADAARHELRPGPTAAERRHASMSDDVYLRFESVVKHYSDVRAVDDVSIDVGREEFLTLLGASGSGKTTLLMTVAGFTMPDRGRIVLDGEDITWLPPSLRNIGVVFQSYALFPHMTVAQNVAYPLHVRKVPRRESAARTERALELVQLGGFGERMPSQLSGGQQQRVALARAVVFEPRLLLMDEPLGALDKKLREYMQLEIKQLQRQLRITVIYVTHDQSEALTMSDRIAIMNDGRFEQVGPPDSLYRAPANRFVADFIGETCFLRAVVMGIEDDLTLARAGGGAVRYPTDIPATPGTEVELMVRPEAVRIATPGEAAAENRLGGVVTEAIYLGELTRYHVRLGDDQTLVMKLQNKDGVRQLRPGDPVTVSWSVRDTRRVE